MLLVDQYETAKLATVALAAIDQTEAHVAGGILIFLGALLFRRGPRFALGVVTALELVNETCDRVHYGSWRWADTVGDIVATLAWPLVLLLAIETARWLRDSRAQPAAARSR